MNGSAAAVPSSPAGPFMRLSCMHIDSTCISDVPHYNIFLAVWLWKVVLTDSKGRNSMGVRAEERKDNE